jgi:hypothetical protein
VVLCAVFLAGCGAASSQAGANDPGAQMQPELIEISPSPARPGHKVELRFPQETERGLGWALEEKGAGTWHLRYYLTSVPKHRATKDAPSWFAADAPEDVRGWDAIGLTGQGPEALRIPDSATPGEYRLCTANAGRNFCAPVDIVE